MKAAVFAKHYDINIEDRPTPELEPHEVLLSVKAAGICGSDLHMYDGSNPYAIYPSIYGHELSGTVAQVGSNVKKIQSGNRVVIEPSIPCGTCYPCRIGKYNCCDQMRFIGAFGRYGGFAEYVAVPQRCIHLMPDEMSFEIGALCEPFTIGAQAISRAAVQDGLTVTILGMGPIGLTILILLKQLYKVKVFAVDVVKERLETAMIFGADEVINPSGCDLLSTLSDLTGGENSNIVFESAGLKSTMAQTVHLVSSGGRIVILGLTKDDVQMPGVLFTRKEVEIYGSRNSAGKFPFIIDFLNRHQELARKFITKTMNFQDIAEAFQTAKTKPNETNKIILNFA